MRVSRVSGWRWLGLIVLGLICSCRTVEIGATSGWPVDGEPGPIVVSPVRGAPAANAHVVLLLIDEKNLGTIPTAEVEALGSGRLRESGCRTVDQEMLRAGIEQRKQMLKNVGDSRAASSLGLQFGADIVVVGDAVCKPAARRIAETGLRSYQAVVTLRAVRTDNASVLAAASEVGTAMDVEDVRGGSKALKAAGRAAFDALLPAMLQAWAGSGGAQGFPTFVHHVEMTFGGVEQLWKVKAIRDRLRAAESLEAVNQRNYTAGAVVFEADSRKPAEELAEELVLEPPQGLTLQVLSVEAGKIVARANAAVQDAASGMK